MSIPVLIAALAARGIELWSEGGQLRYRGPAGALTEDDKATLRARKPALVAYLEARQAAPRPMQPPPPPGALVPSPNQQVWWELVHGLPEQLRMERVPFVLPLASATRQAAEAAVRGLVERHRALRSRFTAGPDGPVLSLNSAEALVVEIEAVDEAAALPGRAMAFVMRPHPVDGPWLTRAAVLHAPGGPTCIVLCFHHIIFDGTSLGLIAEELKRGLSDLPVEAPNVQFTDYAAWERAWFESGAAGPLTDYWRDWLAATPRLTSPGDKDLGWAPGARVDHPLELGPEMGAAIVATAVRARATPFVVILALFGQALASWSGQPRFALRSIGDLRTSQELARTVGLLICADALEVRAPAGGDFLDLVRHMAAEYESAVALRLPTHPAGTGAGYTEFHEQIAATINYVPAGVLRSTAPKPGETEAAREAPWPAPANRAQRLEWPVPLPSIFLRLWEAEDGLAGRLEFNDAVLTGQEQTGLVETLMAAFRALPAAAGKEG